MVRSTGTMVSYYIPGLVQRMCKHVEGERERCDDGAARLGGSQHRDSNQTGE